MPKLHRFKKWKQDEQGAFTIEATILFPIILILIILFILFSLVIYERVTLQYQANRVASQIAHSWGSSTMNVQTGAMEMGDYVHRNGDGLYWRLISNDLYGISIGGDTVNKKLDRAGEYADNVSFNSGLFTQEIEVVLEKQLSLPPAIAEIFGLNSVGATASYPIIEPVEIIRTTDLMLYGYDKLTDLAGEYIPFFSGSD
jgi:hypothetical protein